MQKGGIAQVGKFGELLKQNLGFKVLVGAQSQALKSILIVENSSKTRSLNPTIANEANNTNSTKLANP